MLAVSVVAGGECGGAEGGGQPRPRPRHELSDRDPAGPGPAETGRGADTAGHV